MKAGIDALECLFDSHRISDIPMQKFDLPRQVLSVSTRQIIENAHSVSLPQQRVDEVRAHEASTAGHEKAGHPKSLSCCKRPWRPMEAQVHSEHSAGPRGSHGRAIIASLAA